MPAPIGLLMPPPCVRNDCQAPPGPILLDRLRRIGARMLRGRYPALPDLVAEAIHAASLVRRQGIDRPDDALSRMVRQIVSDALRAGPADDVMLLQLEFVEELPLDAIARLTGMPLAEVRIQRSRAMARLASVLAG